MLFFCLFCWQSPQCQRGLTAPSSPWQWIPHPQRVNNSLLCTGINRTRKDVPVSWFYLIFNAKRDIDDPRRVPCHSDSLVIPAMHWTLLRSRWFWHQVLYTPMEGGKLKWCKSELPALQPSPSSSASSLRLHKGDSQQSWTESSILNAGEQRQTHAKKETTTKKTQQKAHALNRLWQKNLFRKWQ